MVAKSPLWKLFYSNKTNYKTNKTHKNVWSLELVKPTCGKIDSMLAHKRACGWIDPELKRKVDAEIMAKADNPAGDSFVQPSHIAAFNYQPQLPPGYGTSNHSSPSTIPLPPKRMKHSPSFETIPDLTFGAPTDPTASGTLLRNEADRVVAQTRARVEGKLANYQCDGWKNIAKTSLISAMIVVDDEVLPVHTHDTTGRPKTGDELFSLVKADFAFVKETYGVEIIAAVTDDGPDRKKMRRLVKEDPDLRMAVFECWAHQAGLLTGNYLGVKQDFMDGNDIIKWFNNHGKALDLLRNQQILILLKEYALLYPASTRWTSQFTCLSRLSSQEAIILSCVAQHRDELLLTAGPKADAKAKATKIIDRCLKPGFWRDLKRIVRHLEPLAIAANIFQDPSCRLDHVLLTLGNIYDFFDCLDESQDGNKEELFILAVFLNSYIRAKFFNADHLSFIALFHIAWRSFLRLTGNNLANDPVFLRAFTDYYL
ncbi:ribonuclease H-like domain-containing protein [Ephemerocybe angulata]|uniref:Ribonuclease H-like domain-containing protein n=1 Tax=Ephemerocybe angulata TaxID=980116 RepID=A0A8H6HT61_9AGAR|nr:ribonuclease H-like domain-containing protein [Tulosesus angulatus]